MQFAKERVPVWEEEPRKIKDIKTSHGQTPLQGGGSNTFGYPQ
jgi:hypothetical protein